MKDAISCLVCNSNSISPVYKLQYGEILQCQNCNLAFTKFNNINTFYNANKTWNGLEWVKSQIYMLPESRNEAKKRLKLLLKFNPGKRLIEFGPNTGEFLYVAKKAAFDVTGVDQCPAILSLNNVGDIKFINSEATTALLKDKYDAVIAFHLLEHLENPALFLNKIKKILNLGGILFLEIPNYGSKNRTKQKEKWQLFFNYHFTYFDIVSIKKILELCGFKIIYSRTLQPVNCFFDPVYLPLRHLLWSNIKKIFCNNGQNQINNKDSYPQKIEEQLSMEDELRIDKSIKSRLIRLEVKIKKLISLPLYPFAWWISKENQGDILQIIATSGDLYE